MQMLKALLSHPAEVVCQSQKDEFRRYRLTQIVLEQRPLNW